MGRLLRLEDKLDTYRAQQEAASRWDWLAPMLPRLLGAPPSPGLWNTLYGAGPVTSKSFTPGEMLLIVVLMGWDMDLRRDERPTQAELWDGMVRMDAWHGSAPPDAYIPETGRQWEEGRATRPDVAAWWDACPLPRSLLLWRTDDAPDPDRSWVGELLTRLDAGDGWYMAEVTDHRGAVVTRYPWPRPDAPDRLEAARLAEKALDALDALSAAERPQTLEEVRRWLVGM